MPGQINTNSQPCQYFQELRALNLSSDQLRQLDNLNSNIGDRVVDKDVFTIAKSIIDGVPMDSNLGRNSALVEQVQMILRGQGEVAEQFNQTPRGNTADPELVQKILGLSEEQTEALVNLSSSINNGIEGIDKQVFLIAESIVNMHPIKCDEALWNTVSGILQSEPPQPRNLSQFGI